MVRAFSLHPTKSCFVPRFQLDPPVALSRKAKNSQPALGESWIKNAVLSLAFRRDTRKSRLHLATIFSIYVTDFFRLTSRHDHSLSLQSISLLFSKNQKCTKLPVPGGRLRQMLFTKDHPDGKFQLQVCGRRFVLSCYSFPRARLWLFFPLRARVQNSQV